STLSLVTSLSITYIYTLSLHDALPILKAVVIVTMSFIALFVGMAMKSSKATIVSSFLLIFLTQANVGDFSLSDNAVLPAVLMVLSLVFAFLSIYNVETKDLN